MVSVRNLYLSINHSQSYSNEFSKISQVVATQTLMVTGFKIIGLGHIEFLNWKNN